MVEESVFECFRWYITGTYTQSEVLADLQSFHLCVGEGHKV